MHREKAMIKFRGIRKDNNKEVFGYYVKNIYRSFIIPMAASFHKIGKGYERLANPVYEIQRKKQL